VSHHPAARTTAGRLCAVARHVVGVVLGAGAYFGVFHVGALEELRLGRARHQ